MKNINDIRAKSDDELKDAIASHAKERLNLRFQKSNGQVEAVARPSHIRKETARMKTVLRERALGLNQNAAAKTAKKPAAKKASKKAS